MNYQERERTAHRLTERTAAIIAAVNELVTDWRRDGGGEFVVRHDRMRDFELLLQQQEHATKQHQVASDPTDPPLNLGPWSRHVHDIPKPLEVAFVGKNDAGAGIGFVWFARTPIGDSSGWRTATTPEAARDACDAWLTANCPTATVGPWKSAR
jgi:hypothetical protein